MPSIPEDTSDVVEEPKPTAKSSTFRRVLGVSSESCSLYSLWERAFSTYLLFHVLTRGPYVLDGTCFTPVQTQLTDCVSWQKASLECNSQQAHTLSATTRTLFTLGTTASPEWLEYAGPQLLLGGLFTHRHTFIETLNLIPPYVDCPGQAHPGINCMGNIDLCMCPRMHSCYFLELD